MSIITIDFETFYEKTTYSLSKLTTEEYVRDDKFEVIGVAVKVDGGDTEWASGTHEQIKKFLLSFNWEDSAMLAHNCMFDGFIMSERFGITPKIYLDTLCMARALHGVEVGGSLKVLVERYDIGVKGDEVIAASGKRRVDFTEEDINRYGDYCVNDVELTHKLFSAMIRKGFPKTEMKLIDLTLRMFIQPKLDLDLNLLEQHYNDIRDAKARLLVDAGMENRNELMSNPKFAELLKGLGVIPPMKISPTTKKETFAFAKSDEGFKALAEHPDIRVQTLVAARLGTKSTLEETRAERFIGIAKRGLMPVPLKYYAAHTGRWGGSDSLNLQNLPSRGANGGKLKKAIIAPEGMMIIDADSSQIEARVLAWLSGQDDLTEAFKKGEDVYKIMASAIYGKGIEEITKEERFVGKTTILGCISEGTPVLCKSGWKPIEQVSLYDELWDGEEWVCHQGLVKKGYKKTVSIYGTWLTPDHKILCGTKWVETQLVVADENFLCQALGTGAENLPLLGISKEYEGVYPQSLLNVPAEDLSIPLTNITLKTLNLQDAIYALKNQATQLANYIGGIATYLKITNIGKDCLIAYQAVYNAVIQSLVNHTHIMAVEGLRYTKLGARIEKSSYATLYHSMGGMTQNETLTGLTITKDTHQTTYDLQLGLKIPVTKEKLVSCSRNLMTYDIAYAGRRNRFTVRTDKGPIIVHNCGYGMGAQRFGAQLKTFGTEIDDDEARKIIAIYRETYPNIVGLWRQAQVALEALTKNMKTSLGKSGVLHLRPDERAIQLPSGLLMRYHKLVSTRDEKGIQYQYKTRGGWDKIYGGKVIENVCQAIARCIIGEQMLKIAERYNVVLTVHDAVACLVPEAEVFEAQKYVEECMRWTPDWAEGLPVNCESGYGKSYGDC
jgi:DNA polymerase I-like protein with 3'-5' exonuclease and polymerase domains